MERVGHGGVVGAPAVVFVLAQGFDQIVFALTGETRRVFLSRKVLFMAKIAAVLLDQGASLFGAVGIEGMRARCAGAGSLAMIAAARRRSSSLQPCIIPVMGSRLRIFSRNISSCTDRKKTGCAPRDGTSGMSDWPFSPWQARQGASRSSMVAAVAAAAVTAATSRRDAAARARTILAFNGDWPAWHRRGGDAAAAAVSS